MPKFHHKDICIGQYFETDTDLNGAECEILEVSEEQVYAVHFRTRTIDCVPPVCYHVEWYGGCRNWVHESNLRKRPPEQGWKEMEKYGWNPTKEKVNA